MSLFGVYREPRLEVPALAKAIRDFPCCLMVPGVCIGNRDGVMWCHDNSEELGKGKGLKSHDPFGAAGCKPCHDYVDGIDGQRHDDRFELMRMGHYRTLYLLFKEKKVRVTP